MKPMALICGWLMLAWVHGCAGSQAAHQIQQGRLALLTGKPDIAVQHFEKAVALDNRNSGSPLEESTWTYLGSAYYATKNYPLARQAFEKALAQNKEDDIARLYLGLVGARDGMNDSSRQDIQSGLQGIYNRIEYIKSFAYAGEFWDPSGRLSTETLALIKSVAAPQVDSKIVIPRIEQLTLAIENEIDQVQRDELNRYRGGGSGGGDM